MDSVSGVERVTRHTLTRQLVEFDHANTVLSALVSFLSDHPLAKRKYDKMATRALNVL